MQKKFAVVVGAALVALAVMPVSADQRSRHQPPNVANVNVQSGAQASAFGMFTQANARTDGFGFAAIPNGQGTAQYGANSMSQNYHGPSGAAASGGLNIDLFGSPQHGIWW